MITQKEIDEKQIEIEERAVKLSEELKVKVHPMLFVEGDEFIIGFLKEPDRATKTMYLDKVQMSGIGSASSAVCEFLIVKEHSDERILKDDKHFFGACGVVNQVIQASVNQFKKK